MARLRVIAALLALLCAVPARADPVTRWSGYIGEASTRFGIPTEWITRVMRAESGGRTMLGGRPIVSRAGAMGLMQLMPETWADMRTVLRLGVDPFDPHDNIIAGTYYLRLMYDRFGYPGLFGAYNAGPARYAAWIEGRGPLPGETRAYLASVAGVGDGSIATVAARPVNRIFFTLHRSTDGQDAESVGAGMFVAIESTGDEQSRRAADDRPVNQASEIATQ